MYRVYLFIIGVCLSSLSIHAKEPSSFPVDPTPTVTLDMRQVPLLDILLEIEKQTGIFFSYESSLLKEYKKCLYKYMTNLFPIALNGCLNLCRSSIG